MFTLFHLPLSLSSTNKSFSISSHLYIFALSWFCFFQFSFPCSLSRLELEQKCLNTESPLRSHQPAWEASVTQTHTHLWLTLKLWMKLFDLCCKNLRWTKLSELSSKTLNWSRDTNDHAVGINTGKHHWLFSPIVASAGNFQMWPLRAELPRAKLEGNIVLSLSCII